MLASTIRTLFFAGFVAAAGASSIGCYDEEMPPPEYVSEGYQPQYYDGYVVYYDGVGRPYYYVDGAVFWVPHTAPVYVRLVNHWHYYGPAYHRWYARHGYRYRSYRWRR